MLILTHANLDPVLQQSYSLSVNKKRHRMLDCWFIENNWFFADALSSQYSPDTTLALLQTSAAQAEEEAEVNWK